jgi:hypothetical protein
MVEVKVRVDDVVDLAGVAVDRFQARLHVVLGAIVLEAEDARHALAESARGVGAALRMHAGVEQRAPLGMLDEVGRDRQGHLAVLAFDHVLQAADETAAGHGIELRRHRFLSSTAKA